MSTVVTAAELKRDAQEFLRFKRAMGISYRRAEFALDSFVRFVTKHWGEQATVPLDGAVTRWAARRSGCKAVTVGNEFGVIRQLCLYRRRRDPTGFVPEHAVAPVKESVFLPYIFTEDEVRRLLAAATAHEGRFIWGGMLRPFILVLYCTGVRLGEAVRLQRSDVVLEQATLMIRHSKGRSRIVPIRADLVAELRRYVEVRQQRVEVAGRGDPTAFFLRKDASPLTPPIRPRRPCVDVQAKLPWLSAYLGHQNVLGTEVYLKATPQLLALASASKRTRGVRVKPHEHHVWPTGAVCLGRSLLHRVSAASARGQRAYGACLSGCLEVVIGVRRPGAGAPTRRLGTEGPGGRNDQSLSRSHRDRSRELGRHAQLPPRCAAQLLPASTAKRS